MKINSSYLFAGAAVIAIVLWFMVNSKEAREAPPRPKTTITVEKTVPTVVFESVSYTHLTLPTILLV